MRTPNGLFYQWGCGLLALGVWAAPRPSWGAETPTVVGQVKASRDQARLEVRRVGPVLQAVACPRACDWSQASTWTLEAPFADAAATFTALELGEGRRAAHVVVAAGERRFEVVVAAPLKAAAPPGEGAPHATPALAPVVAYADETGLTNGEEPDRTGTLVEVLPAANHTVNVVVGAIQEDVALCGRKALLSPRLLHAQTLSSKAIKLQRLPSAERDAAPHLRAEPLTNQIASNVLTPLVASSGKGSPAALVDNDAQTTWTENRGGSGGGEFVVFRAPDSLGITGLTFTTPARPAPHFQPPTAFWVATPDAVFRVELPRHSPTSMPDSAASAASAPTAGPASTSGAPSPSAAPTPAAPTSDTEAPASAAGPASTAGSTPRSPGEPAPIHEWYVALPAPIQTACLALSLDTAEQNDGDIDVGFAEVGATTDVDESKLSLALAHLDTGGDQATAAERLLQDVGRAAFERVATRYRGYSDAGRMRALNVLDAAPCRYSVGVYVAALSNEGSAEAEHGKAGLLRCRKQAVPALARRLPESASERTRLLTNVLVPLDPVAAVDAMTPLLGGGSRAKRRVLQLAFRAAIANPDAAARAKLLLSDAPLDPRASIFLMRALGNRLVDVADVAAPRLRQWVETGDFATRYLALSPAAVLAPSDAALQSFLVAALSRDQDPALRTEAARVLQASGQTSAALVGAIADPHVRVREAAVVRAGEQALLAARGALHERLARDAWPLVRSAAVRALAELPVTPETTRRLADAVAGDESPEVRRPAVHALGIQNAQSELAVVREAFSSDADADVRATAATSLGLMCDRGRLSELTASALKFGKLAASEEERLVGKASLNAVGRLNPPDLQRRLAPLLAKGVPQIAQGAARAALSHPEPCGRPTPPPSTAH